MAKEGKMEQKTVKLILIAVAGLIILLIIGVFAALLLNKYRNSEAISIKAFQASVYKDNGDKIFASWVEFTPKKPVSFAGLAIRPERGKRDVEIIQNTPMFRIIGANDQPLDSTNVRAKNGSWLFLPKEDIVFPANRPASVEFGILLGCTPELAAANPRVRLRLVAIGFVGENGKAVRTFPAQISEFVALNCDKTNPNPPK